MSDPTADALSGTDDAAFQTGDSPQFQTLGSPEFRAAASPALRTVVAAVRAAVADDAPAAVPTDPETAPTDLDWERVRAIARRHQVVPLVFEGLSESDAPASAVEPLREAVQRNARRNLQLTWELLGVLDSFADAGVRAISIKGPVLAVVAYGDLSRRMFLDLDLLVHPNDALDAGRVLRRRGYDAGAEFAQLRRFGKGSPLLADVNECSFRRADRGNEVELRWRHGHWANPLSVSFDDWWRRREEATLAGRDVPILSPEDRMLLLTTHANKHAWRRLAWVADVAASLRAHDALDWDVLERRARSWGVTPALYVGIALCDSLFDDVDAVPAEVRRRVRDDRLVNALADRAASRLAADPLGTPSRLEESAYDFLVTASNRTMLGLPKRVTAASIRKLTRLTERA